MVDFHGWEMPIEYSKIIDEHIAVRNSAGIFDVSHMGDIIISGLDVNDFIDHVFPTDITSMEPGHCIYTAFLNDEASIIDDTIIYKINEKKYFFVPNAANIDIIFNWLKKNASGYDVEIKNVSDEIACIALQGPMYEEVLKKIGYKTVLPFTFSYEKSRFKNAITGGNDIIISGTGYTGEKGVEIICSSDEAVEIWRNLNEVLKPINGKPCGLGCRDTLRMEKGMLLSGVDFNNDKTPYECSISFILIFFINEFICLPYAFLLIETSMMFIPFTLLSPVSEEIIMSPAHVPIMGKPSFAFSFITSYRPYSRMSLYMVVLSPPGIMSASHISTSDIFVTLIPCTFFPCLDSEFNVEICSSTSPWNPSTPIFTDRYVIQN